jgi:hypothetical protein
VNGTKIEPKVDGRRLLVRGILAVVYIAVMVLAFVMGKGHTILLDNKDSEDGSVKAFENVSVSVDGQEAIDFMAGDRDQAKVRAQWHTVKIVANGQTIEKKITVPLGENILLLSIPKLAAGTEPAVIPFVQADEPAPPADPNAGVSNEFTSPGGTPETPAVPGVPAAPGTPAPVAAP